MKEEADRARVLSRATPRLAAAAAPKCVIAAILALSFIVDPNIGSFTSLRLQKTIVKREVRKHIIDGIDDCDLVLLRFSKEESESLLQWEHSREFEYDGQMYDVVETWTLGDTVYFRCWWDREETKLNGRLRKLAARTLREMPKFGEKAKPRSSSPKSSSFILTREWNVLTPESSAVRIWWAYSDSYHTISIQPPTPPPRTA